MDLHKKIQELEKELSSLKSLILKIVPSAKQKKIVPLKGSLKGIKVSESVI